jgi:hypothetical protein
MFVIVIAIVSVSISVALAATKKNYLVTGDKWEFGTNVFTFKYYSNYYRPFGTHGASVKNEESGEFDSETAPALFTAKTKVGASWSVDGTAKCW